jgi:hypothetical protein
MPYSIIVGNVLTNGITQNGNLDFGHTANSKSVGACFSFGNTSPSVAHMLNNNCDPDISDQGQIDNTSTT